MKQKIFSLFSLLIIFSLVLSSGNTLVLAQLASEGDVAQSDTTTITYLPMVTRNLEILEPVIPETTEVLTDVTLQYLFSISPDGVVYTFFQDTAELGQVSPGDVIVGDVSRLTPFGFLRLVTEVSEEDGKIILTTQPVTLEEAIQDGELSASVALSPEDIHSSILLEGINLDNSSQAVEGLYFEYTLDDVVLYDDDGDPGTTGDQVIARGSIRFELEFNFDIKVKYFQLKELYFTTTTKETADLTVETLVGASLEKDVEIAHHTFTPITFTIGPVPVVITPELTVTVGADGSVHAGVSTGVTQEATATAGLRYASGSWFQVDNFTNEFTYLQPTLSTGLNLRCYTKIELSLMIYGVVGPHAAVNTYIELEAELLPTLWWGLYGGLEVPVGIEVEVLSHVVAGYEAIVIDYRVLLAQAETNHPPDMPSEPNPPDDATDQSVEAILSWIGDDPDGDEVSYDVYLEAGNSTPDVLVSGGQSGTTYDPGTLSYNTQYFWQIIAHDEYGAITYGPIWDFTTETGENCPINLTLGNPQVVDFTVTVDGTATSDCLTITNINWQWGDGEDDNQWFPAYHTYTNAGTYTIIATAYGNLGNIASRTTTAYVGYDIGDMTYIPAGEFQMGCDLSRYECNLNELPLHTVYLDAYLIDTTEVTNAEYAQCVAAGGCVAPYYPSSKTRQSYYDNPIYADYPVVWMMWWQADMYCRWMGGRLPTEAEWEKAARGSSDTRTFPWGDQDPDCSLANFYDAYDTGYCVGDTSQVGSYPSGASQYGVLDMAGNVWEWVNDWFQEDYYTVSPYENPMGPESGTYKVFRGGSFYYIELGLRVAFRTFGDPHNSTMGFRCAMPLGK